MQAAQNAEFTILYGPHAHAEEAVTHNPQCKRRGDDELRAAHASPRIHEFAEKEKEDKRKQIVKKNDRPLSCRYAQLGRQQRQIGCHHSSSPVRRSPVSLRNTSSSVGRETATS